MLGNGCGVALKWVGQSGLSSCYADQTLTLLAAQARGRRILHWVKRVAPRTSAIRRSGLCAARKDNFGPLSCGCAVRAVRPLAHSSEDAAVMLIKNSNQGVAGSSPAGVANEIKGLTKMLCSIVSE